MLSKYKTLLALYSRASFITKNILKLRLILLSLDEIEKIIPKQCRILDMGCGHGLLSNFLVLKSEKRKVTGIDLSKKRIMTAKTTELNRPNVKFFLKDISKVNTSNFKTILMVDLLHHIPYSEQSAILKKIYRNMNNKSILIIKDIDNEPYWKYIWNRIHDTIISRGNIYPNGKLLAKIIKEVGFSFKTLKIRGLTPIPHICYVCNK